MKSKMKFLNPKEVAEIAGKKESWAYNLIRQLNEELKEQGYLTARGRVPEGYFYQRTGLNYHNKEE